MRVRHLPNGSEWHPIDDNLVGTESYGDQADYCIAWSIKFDTIVFDEFLFVTGDSAVWLTAKKD